MLTNDHDAINTHYSNDHFCDLVRLCVSIFFPHWQLQLLMMNN